MKKGSKHSEETLKRISEKKKGNIPWNKGIEWPQMRGNQYAKGHAQNRTTFKKGQIGYWTGKKFTEEHKQNLSKVRKGKHHSPATEFKKGKNKGNENYSWKNDKVSYSGAHHWIKREKGKPTICTFCKSEKFIEWANKSHKYLRDVNDYFALCRKCHKKYDYEYKLQQEV